jgi:hypothetical protein
LGVLLAAAHARFEMVPVRKIRDRGLFGLLAEVFRLGERYEVLAVLTPWVEKWRSWFGRPGCIA